MNVLPHVLLHVSLLTALLACQSAAARVKTVLPGEGTIDPVAEQKLRATIDEMRQVEEEVIEEEPSPYDFGDSWHGLSFEERWQSFLQAVPVEELQDHWDPEVDTGPACHPSLEGPVESDNLAILLHGFTSCPGVLFPHAAKMRSQGFRVMRPTLPGHGRKWEEEETDVESFSDLGADSSEDDSEDSNETRARDLDHANEPGQLTIQRKDDLSSFPEEPGPYLHFAEALGKLVEQFKKEHPRGKVVVLGHSLGGMVAAKFAMERPHVVDRLLLMNPMFGLPSNLVAPMLKLGADVRVSWAALGNERCEKNRGKGAGGTCQFKLANVLAMQNFAYLVLCEQWGLTEACRYYSAKVAGYVATGVLGGNALFFAGAGIGSLLGPLGAIAGGVVGGTVGVVTGLFLGGRAGATLGKVLGKFKVDDPKKSEQIRRGFASLAQIQLVATSGDPAVDNKRGERLLEEVAVQRAKYTAQAAPSASSYCYWPAAIGHSYTNARDVPEAPPWIHPYVEDALCGYLATGTFVDIVQRKSAHWGSNIKDVGLCLRDEFDVAGGSLTLLPAVQHRSHYALGSRLEGDQHSATANVLLAGDVFKQGESTGFYHWRHVEALSLTLPKSTVGGLSPGFSQVTLLVTRMESDGNIRDIFMLVGTAKREDTWEAGNCVLVKILKLSNGGTVPLSDQVMHAHIPLNPKELRFCRNPELVNVVCDRQTCAPAIA